MNIEEFLEEFRKLYRTIMEKYSWECTPEGRDQDRKPRYIRFTIDMIDGKIRSAWIETRPNVSVSFQLDDEKAVQSMLDWLDKSNETT